MNNYTTMNQVKQRNMPKFHLMENKMEFEKSKDVEKLESKRKRKEKLQDMEDAVTKMSKITKRITKPNTERDEVEDIVFDALNDKQPSISAVAGITLTKESSPLLSISGKPMVSEAPIKLGIKSISDLEAYRNGEEDVKLSILFHDGNTCVKGIAFGASARKWKKTLNALCTYKVCSYEIRKSKRKYENTKFEIHLTENTFIKKLKNGYAEIPEETQMKIAELDKKFENLLVSTSKVKITKIEPLERPKEKFLRFIHISDATGKIRIKIWSREAEEFPHNEGEFVKLKYVYLRFNRKYPEWYLGQSDNMLFCQCDE